MNIYEIQVDYCTTDKTTRKYIFNDISTLEISAGQYQPSSGLFGDQTNLQNLYTYAYYEVIKEYFYNGGKQPKEVF